MLIMSIMHPIQESLLALSKIENLAVLSLRQMAGKIGMKEEMPQKIKHHLQQLERKGFLSIDRNKGVMNCALTKPGWAKGLGEKSSALFAIPIIGTANCGPATIFAEENFQGFLRVSNRLLRRARPDHLFAIRADGSSMNAAEIDGRRLEDGDFAIVDGRAYDPKDRDAVLAIIDRKATIKRFVRDRANQQVVLMADSSFDYDPIYLHEDDDFSINGKVIAVIKKPKF